MTNRLLPQLFYWGCNKLATDWEVATGTALVMTIGVGLFFKGVALLE